jgi:cell division protease FtsH
LEEAIERVVMGPERKSRLISDEEKRIIAYHEAGHAIVANAIAEADPVQKVTIVGRGQAGGVTWFRPDEDRILMSRKKMLATLAMALGGRAAEELIFDDITSGASGDIEQVTRMARAMVTRLGMSAEMGTLMYGQKEELIFLGREISEQRDYSEAVAEQIDREVRKIVEDAYKQAKDTGQEIPQAVGHRCQETARSGIDHPRRVRSSSSRRRLARKAAPRSCVSTCN